MPTKWEADSRLPLSAPRPVNAVSLAWKLLVPARLDWISIFDDVNQLISLDRALTGQALVAATTSGSWMEPTLIRLLSIRPLYLGQGPENVMEEVCRLGTLMFLAPIWRSMGADPVRTDSFSRNLLVVLNTYRMDWGDLRPLLVWTVYFAAIESTDTLERGQYIFMLAMLMMGMHIKEWEELRHIIKAILWVEKVFAKSEDSVRDEVMALVTRKTSGGLSSMS
jgi:hypothetical protein